MKLFLLGTSMHLHTCMLEQLTKQIVHTTEVKLREHWVVISEQSVSYESP